MLTLTLAGNGIDETFELVPVKKAGKAKRKVRLGYLNKKEVKEIRTMAKEGHAPNIISKTLVIPYQQVWRVINKKAYNY